MSEQVIRNTKVVNRSKTRNLVQVAMLGAVAGVLMNFEFPIPILAPPFYQMDFSEVPVLLGAFAMGPVAGVVIELIKVFTTFCSTRDDDGWSGRTGKLYFWLCICSASRVNLPLPQ